MTRSAIRSEERRWRRGDMLVIIAAIMFGIAMAWIVLRVQALTSDLQTQYVARDALARQVQHLGGKPIAGPPGSRGEPGKAVRGSQGAKGDTGRPGSPGPSGSPGKAGDDGTDGVGETGPSGATGVDGVAGPPGPAGEPGPAGPQGEQGPPGTDGADGTDGRDGQVCPDGYSLQPPADDPDALVCRRDSAPDPEPDGEPTPQAAALDPQRRQY